MKLNDLKTTARIEIEIEVFEGELNFINECLKDVEREDHRIVKNYLELVIEDLKRILKGLKEEELATTKSIVEDIDDTDYEKDYYAENVITHLNNVIEFQKEKYDRGQKGFTEKVYEELLNYICEENY